ncbi:hypothetical protein SAMN05192560_0380 [Methylobacillus rhizosphaerae]|uniref:Uncharacterized protein n=1 Tax=Methylobacillus rhizosphaerae TaxID=551994 RepID=A0A238Y2G8_9PROT|nr:hypothetical protein [Methylobacillus rhizosphaerae]SNR65200.1 hypothetical protein SAMN05192560_0380 [Methylobacillus rhizosphaerae]
MSPVPAICTISAQSQKRCAQMFNLGSIIAITLMPAFPILFIWIGISIFVYSANIQHPCPQVRKYTQYAGYRFYGISGCLLASMIFAGVLIPLVGDAWHLVLILWAIAFTVVVPAGLSSLIKAHKESWHDMTVEQP